MLAGRTRTKAASKHWLDIICDVERRLGLCFDLVNGDTLSELNECQTAVEVNIKDALETSACKHGYEEMRLTMAYQFSDDP